METWAKTCGAIADGLVLTNIYSLSFCLTPRLKAERSIRDTGKAGEPHPSRGRRSRRRVSVLNLLGSDVFGCVVFTLNTTQKWLVHLQQKVLKPKGLNEGRAVGTLKAHEDREGKGNAEPPVSEGRPCKAGAQVAQVVRVHFAGAPLAFAPSQPCIGKTS